MGSAPEARTRPGASQSASFLTSKRSASRRANTPESASATTHATAPGAMKERPADMPTVIPNVKMEECVFALENADVLLDLVENTVTK